MQNESKSRGLPSPRFAAYSALLKVERDNAYSNLALDETLAEMYPRRSRQTSACSGKDDISRDKSFAAALFYGALERQLTLNTVISRFSKISLKKLDVRTLVILRLGVYQLLFMDKVPTSAAVNESVKLCVREKLHSSKGFVNGVLRSVARQEESLTEQFSEYTGRNAVGTDTARLYSDKLEYLSVKYSCPKNIISLWASDYSRELAEGILGSFFGRPPLYVRVNTLKTTGEELARLLAKEGVTAVPVRTRGGEKTSGNSDNCEIFQNSLELRNVGSLTELDCYRRGLFHVQSLASQLACEVLSPCEGDTVADVCAAPGGKSFTCAQLMNDKGQVYSYDIHTHRVQLIERGAQRLGISCVRAQLRDALSDEPLPMSDKVLCDVPCSGLGTLARKPELRYKENLGLDTLPDIQYRILCGAARYVKRGGTLVYSACTLHRAENGDIAERFLKEHEDFSPLKIDPPSIFKHMTDEPENELTVFPQAAGDGFFIAAFKKKLTETAASKSKCSI